MAKRRPHIPVDFDVNYPATRCGKMNDILLFQPDDTVRAISFDGHFGIHRPLRNLDPSRTVKLKGHPRTKKILREHDRSCTCRTRDCVRLVLPQRTAGWQFAVDPSSRRMLGAIEHCQNENNAEKAKLLSAVMGMDKVEADLLIHDDACHFEQFIKKKKYSEHFDNIRYFVVDVFHRSNHHFPSRHGHQPRPSVAATCAPTFPSP